MHFSILLFVNLLLKAALPQPAAPLALPVQLRCEYQQNPLGIDVQQPQLSWQMQDSRQGARQTAYQVLVASSEELLQKNVGDIWNSSKVSSDESVHVLYGGPALQARKRYVWKVKIWDQAGKPSPWSEAAWWEMGLLNATDWQAAWIGKDLNPPSAAPPAANWIWHPQDKGQWHMVYLRKSIQIPKEKQVEKAVIQAAIDDSYEINLNNRVVTAIRNFEPMRGLQFHTYDVTSTIQSGLNTLLTAGVFTGKRPEGRGGLVMSLTITFTDGTTQSVVTDNTWEAAVGEKPGWSTDLPDPVKWLPAKVIEPVNGPIFGKVKPAYISPRAILVRKAFTLPKKVRQARAYVTGLGGYYLHLNGKVVSRDIMAPGWTNYYKRIQYQTYDVTKLLQEGPNVIGAELGNLWWSGDVGWRGMGHYADGPLRLLMQLHLSYEDGSTETIVTDRSWKAHTSPITFNSIYDGEHYDARLEIPGWDRAGLEDSKWQPVDVIAEKKDILVAEQLQPIQTTQEIVPVSVKEISPGKYIFDLGQNIAGWARLKVQGPAGTKIRLRFAEILNEDGSLKTEPLRSAKATDEYILKGKGVEVWEPRFTYHGFQFIEITGFPGKPDKDALTGVVLHTNAPVQGQFTSSNELINQIQRNITWGLRGNMHSVVTDCPQRDERMGWTGDAQIFAMTAHYNRDMTRMFYKYMRDITDSQVPNGNVCNTNPNPFEEGTAPAGWADAIVIVPWRVYQFTGDKRILEENYPAMVKWHEQKQRESQNYIREAWTFGDWVSVEKTPEKPISAWYHYYSTKLLGSIAQTLQKTDEAQRYRELAAKIAEASNEKYLDKKTLYYEGGTQTANLLPLAFGMTSPENAPRVAMNLVENVKQHDNHLTTGFLGTQYILPVLTQFGHHDLAYKLATQRTYPSWGYMVDKGATTMWELWNSDTQGADMNSRNHYAYGTVGEWFFGYLAGIRPDDSIPGFKRAIIAPQPVGDLQWVAGSLETMYGTVKSRWERKNGQLILQLTVPANTTALVTLPFASVDKVTEGGKSLQKAKGIKDISTTSGRIQFEAAAGQYEFVGASQ